MAHAGPANPPGYLPMLQILTGLGILGAVLAFLLRQRTGFAAVPVCSSGRLLHRAAQFKEQLPA
jgi:hypothetical protein